MATRSRTTFQKRQKEIARMEKQREKAARRMQRKLGQKPAEETPEGGLTSLPEPPQPESGE